MLVIRRRAGESFFIGDDIEVHVLEVAASQVKVGIKARREIPVLRRELYLTAAQNRSAAGLPGGSVPKVVETLRAVIRKSQSKPAAEDPNSQASN